MQQWNDDQPIYRQLQERMLGFILDGTFEEAQAIPSVRTLAAEYQVNHLTVSKACQALVDDGLIEKRRGLGMFVTPGAQKMILELEKKQFLTVELPRLIQRIQQLGISTSELIDELNKTPKAQP
jgi:GntR family transcriptional regulator